MRSRVPSFLAVSLLLASATASAGCVATSLCSPTALAATSGTIVSSVTSPAYRAQLASKNGVESPHLACRAETTIPVTIAAVDDPRASDPGLDSQFSRPGSAQGPAEQHVGYSTKSNPHLHGGSLTAATQQGQYRVLGLGRGTDHDDCANAAMVACDGAVEEYFRRTRTLRTPGIVCQVDANEERCAASTR